MKILSLFFTCEDTGAAMVINMISQLQESFTLRCAAGSFEISFTKWLRGVGISSVSIKKTEHYMAAWGHEFYLLMLKVSLTHS